MGKCACGTDVPSGCLCADCWNKARIAHEKKARIGECMKCGSRWPVAEWWRVINEDGKTVAFFCKFCRSEGHHRFVL